MKIAILYNKTEKLHSTNWSLAWEEFCNKNQLDYTIVNPYDIGVVQRLMDFDVVLWHYSNYSYKDMLMAKNIMNTLQYHGKKIFPSFNDAWHFDDKLAETYLLESVDAPIPKSFYFFDLESVREAISGKGLQFPTIAKLRNGSGSHNVKMLHNSKELLEYSSRMFTTGLNSAPSLMYKTKGNIRSAKNLKTLIARAKRIPEFLRSLSNAKKFNVEKGYVYLQEFIPNDGYDLKIVVIGDKLSFIGRNIRQGDFRASGGGDIFYDKDVVTQNVIDSAFRTSDELGFNCMGYDYVVDKNSGKGIIIEISYGFAHEALLKAGGYFDRAGKWHDTPLNAPEELLKNLL